MSVAITVSTMGPGYRLDMPCLSIAHTGRGESVVLTRDEAFDLLEKLRIALASDTSLVTP